MPNPRLDQAIAALKRDTSDAGAREAALAERERSLGQPMPPPVRQLLAQVSAKTWSGRVNAIALLPPDECHPLSTLFELPDDESGRVGDPPYFIFANGDFGDAVMCDAAGRIVLADHEAGEAVILGRSLAEWIERLLAFNGDELAYMQGGVDDIAPEAARRFLNDHLSLNPGSEWAARKLMQLDHPHGHPLGYHHWDRENNRLVPIAQATDAHKIDLTAGSQRDVDSLADARDCRYLMIVRGSVSDFSPLTKIRSLTDLYIYDIPRVDARQLASCPALKDLCFLRCRVDHVDALAEMGTLKRLRLNECHVDEGEMERYRSKRRDSRLS